MIFRYRREISNGFLVAALLALSLFGFQNCSPYHAATVDMASVNGALDIAAGKLLYEQKCSSCHATFDTSTKVGRSASQISTALASVAQMQGLNLSSDQVDAIALALSGTTVPAPVAPGGIPTLPLNGVRIPVSTARLETAGAFGVVPLRRLTKAEVLASVNDIIGVPADSFIDRVSDDLTDDTLTPFDNNSDLQSVSPGVVEAYDSFAQAYAASLLSKRSTIDALAGCQPQGVADQSCFNSFATKVARRFLRRNISSTDLQNFSVLLQRAQSENNFYLAPSLLVQALLSHPEFLYRIEQGAAVPGTSVRALNDFEIATRLSYLLWGSAPDHQLLDAATAKKLVDESERLAQASRMLSDARAKPQWRKFHKQWLGYDKVDVPSAIAADLQLETDKLIEQIVFNSNSDWLSIFTYDQAFLTPALATHYGAPVPNSPSWVARPGGILANGQFLAQGAKFGDTSPTLRGYRVLKRVLCQKFGEIPADVDTTRPPAGSGSNCKTDSYNMRHQPSCVGCHALTDNIGFGLESFGVSGQFRLTEPGRPQCEIKSEGAVGEDLFTGVAELGARLAGNPVAGECASRQLMRFSLGRMDTAADQALVEALHAQYRKTPQLKEMLLSIIRSPAFTHK